MKIPSVAAPQARRSRLTNGYAVTIVYNRKQFITSAKLFNKLQKLKDSMSKYGTEWSNYVAIEIKDTTNVLHLHTYCTCTRSPWVKHNSPWNIQLKPITPGTEQYWIKYLNKHDACQYAIEQRETLSQFYLQDINNLFQD